MFTAESNAVNLTDGLDGLCAGVLRRSPCSLMSSLRCCRGSAQDLGVAVCCAWSDRIAGLSASFNLHPAKVFMGDTGSLAHRRIARCGTAMVTKQELLLVLIGGVFVIEVLSVSHPGDAFQTDGRSVIFQHGADPSSL